MNNMNNLFLTASISLLILSAIVIIVDMSVFGAEIEDITNYKTYEDMHLLQNIEDIETFDTVIINLPTFKAEYQNNYLDGFEFLHLVAKQEKRVLDDNNDNKQPEQQKYSNIKPDGTYKTNSEIFKDLEQARNEVEELMNNETIDPKIINKLFPLEADNPYYTDTELTAQQIQEREALETKQEKYKDLKLPLDGSVEDTYQRVEITNTSQEDIELRDQQESIDKDDK